MVIMRITWRQALESLIDVQLNQSVLFFDGELHPTDDDDSKLVPLRSIGGYEDADPLQYVLIEPLIDSYKAVDMRRDAEELGLRIEEYLEKRHSRTGVRVTWRQVSEQLTNEQLDRPVLFYYNFDGALHPVEQSVHPGYDFDTKLILLTLIPGYEEYDKLQVVITGELSEEGSLACDYLHFSELLKTQLTLILRFRNFVNRN